MTGGGTNFHSDWEPELNKAGADAVVALVGGLSLGGGLFCLAEGISLLKINRQWFSAGNCGGTLSG